MFAIEDTITRSGMSATKHIKHNPKVTKIGSRVGLPDASGQLLYIVGTYQTEYSKTTMNNRITMVESLNIYNIDILSRQFIINL